MAAQIPLEWNALICFAARGDIEAVKCLTEATVSTRADIREMTIVRKKIPPDTKGLYGDSALHAACSNGHVEIVEYLLSQNADPSIQNDLGQTPLFVASMHGQVKCCEKLITGGTDMKRISSYGKNALNVAGTGECAFLLRSLQNDDEEEEARIKAEQTRRRLELMMIRWSKASMVDGYKTWKEFALVPESKISRLAQILEAIGSEEKYESPQLGIIAHAQAKNTDFDGAQFVVYNGRKGLGVQGGSGHPLIHGTDEAWQAQINGGLFSPVANQAAAARKAIEARKNPVIWSTGKIELPDTVFKKIYQETEATAAQLEELESDIWGLRSISTARQWCRAVIKHLTTAEIIVTRFHFVMDDPRPGTGQTNMETIRASILRMVDRLVRPHRTMLHGLRPRAFRTAAVKNAQAIVNSSAFPSNFPGAPSDRRLFTSRFVHTWAWMTACNNPPGYVPLPDVQDLIRRVAGPLKLDKNPEFMYLANECFRPREEDGRLHIQPLNIPLPPRHNSLGAPENYYAKALAKVDDEPSTKIEHRPQAPRPNRGGYDDDDESFPGSLMLHTNNTFVDDFVF